MPDRYPWQFVNANAVLSISNDFVELTCIFVKNKLKVTSHQITKRNMAPLVAGARGYILRFMTIFKPANHL